MSIYDQQTIDIIVQISYFKWIKVHDKRLFGLFNISRRPSMSFVISINYAKSIFPQNKYSLTSYNKDTFNN